MCQGVCCFCSSSGRKWHEQFFSFQLKSVCVAVTAGVRIVSSLHRLKKKEFSLEEIYTNKNYKSPPASR